MSTFLGMPATRRRGVGHLRGERAVPGRGPRRARPTPSCAATSATPPRTIRAKRAAVVGEVPDWEELRDAGAAIKAATMARLDELLEQLEAEVTARGGDRALGPRRGRGQPDRHRRWSGPPAPTEVVKVKSMATQEIGLNEALEAAGIAACETDLAELIVQLGRRQAVAHPGAGDPPQPRRDPGDLPARDGPVGLPAPADLTDDPRRAGEAARAHLRRKFLTAKVAVSGANFAVAETGTLVGGRVRGQRPDVPDPAARP